MALDTSNLSLVGYGSGTKMWMYDSTDTSATINASGYFNTTDIPLMAVGDIIFVVSATGGTPVGYTCTPSAIAAASSTIVVFKGGSS